MNVGLRIWLSCCPLETHNIIGKPFWNIRNNRLLGESIDSAEVRSCCTSRVAAFFSVVGLVIDGLGPEPWDTVVKQAWNIITEIYLKRSVPRLKHMIPIMQELAFGTSEEILVLVPQSPLLAEDPHYRDLSDSNRGFAPDMFLAQVAVVFTFLTQSFSTLLPYLFYQKCVSWGALSSLLHCKRGSSLAPPHMLFFHYSHTFLFLRQSCPHGKITPPSSPNPITNSIDRQCKRPVFYSIDVAEL